MALFVGLLVIWSQGGLRGEKLAIKITPTAIYGPGTMGWNDPLAFDEIDYEKTRKKKTIYGLGGYQIGFRESVFEPEDADEIWRAIDGFERQAIRKARKEEMDSG